MANIPSVIQFYTLCNRLKSLIRTGWQDWHVQASRLESVAEHIYGTQMLAIAMYSEFHYSLDLTKVLYMLAIHELGETVIGDLTQFQISREEKSRIEHEAVHNILQGLLQADQIEALFLEFEVRETTEARFAYQCDKLECDLQCKLYDEACLVDLTQQGDNATCDDAQVKQLLQTGASWSDMWLRFGQQRYDYDENFKAVSDYALSHDLSCNELQKN